MNRKAFILVGHSNWGKSETMHALKKTRRRIFYIKIKDEWILIRTRSNDDIPKDLLRMIKTIVKWNNKIIIILLCPRFNEMDTKNTKKIIDILKTKFELYFFVLHKKYGTNKYITDKEIAQLRKFGKVTVYNGTGESIERGRRFKEYIEENLTK